MNMLKLLVKLYTSKAGTCDHVIARISVVVVMTLALGACGHTRVDLSDRKTTTFLASGVSPELAYRRAVEGLQTCYLQAQFEVINSYFPDNRSSQIALSSRASTISIQFLRVLIANDGDGAKVRVDENRSDVFERAVSGWVLATGAPCPGAQ